MSYDPQWKEKLEARRAKHPPAKTALGQGCLWAALAGCVGFVLIGACHEKPRPPRAERNAVAKELAQARSGQQEEVRERKEAEEEAIRQAEQARLLEQIERERQWIEIADLKAGVENQLAWEKRWVGVKGRVVGSLTKSAREFGGTPFVMLRDEQGHEVKVLLESQTLVEWAAAKSLGARVVLHVEVKGLSPVGQVVNLIGLDAELP